MLFDPALFNDDFLNLPVLDRLFSRRRVILDRIEKIKPKIVALSIVTDRYRWALDLAKGIKGRVDTTIIAGGIHVTGATNQVLSEGAFDYCVRGEGDRVIAPLVKSLHNGNVDFSIPNLSYRRNCKTTHNPLGKLINNLDSLPFPDKEIFSSFDNGDMYTIMASRGCPFACSFCNNSLFKELYKGQKAARFRSVDNVMAELEMAKKKFSPRIINFLDEIFGAKPSWLEEFAEKYPKKIKIPFIACTHPAIENEKRVDLLKKAGCVKVDMGVQTISERLRKDILFRTETTIQVARAINLYNKRGIVLFAENILGLPTETEEDQQKMVKFYMNNKPSAIKVFWLSYYPGAAIVHIAEKQGILSEKDLLNIDKGIGAGSIAQGGHMARRSTRQIYIALQLLHLFSTETMEKILKKRWYRFFPTFWVKRFAYLIGRFTNRQSKEAEVLMIRSFHHYLTGLKTWFFDFFR